MRTNFKILGAIAVAGVVAATGSAFTNSNTFAADATEPLTGYKSTTVSGGTINSLSYNLDASGANIESVTLVLLGDTTTSDVSLNFNGGTMFSCGVGDPATGTTTSYQCDVPVPEQSTEALLSTGVVIA